MGATAISSPNPCIGLENSSQTYLEKITTENMKKAVPQPNPDYFVIENVTYVYASYEIFSPLTSILFT